MGFVQVGLFDEDPSLPIFQELSIGEFLANRGTPPHTMLQWIDARFAQKSYGYREGDSPEREGTFLFRTAVIPEAVETYGQTDPSKLRSDMYYARVGARFDYGSTVLEVGNLESGLVGTVQAGQEKYFDVLVLVALREIGVMVENMAKNMNYSPGFHELSANGYIEIHSENVERLNELLRNVGIFCSIIEVNDNHPDPDAFNTSLNRLDESQAKAGKLKIAYQSFIDRILS